MGALHPTRAALAAVLCLGVAAGDAAAMPLLDPVPPPQVASAAAKKKSKKLNRKVTVTGGVRLSPTTKLGTTTYGEDGVVRVKGTTVAGRLAGKLGGSAKSRRGLPRAVKRMLKLTFSGKLDLSRYSDPEAFNPIVATGTLGGTAKGKPKLAACAKFSFSRDAKQALVQKLTLTGSAGRARYRITGQIRPISLNAPVGYYAQPMSLRVKSVRKAKVSKSCRAFIKKAPKR